MAQTVVRLLAHLVFSTKNRRNLITPAVAIFTICMHPVNVDITIPYCSPLGCRGQ